MALCLHACVQRSDCRTERKFGSAKHRRCVRREATLCVVRTQVRLQTRACVVLLLRMSLQRRRCCGRLLARSWAWRRRPSAERLWRAEWNQRRLCDERVRRSSRRRERRSRRSCRRSGIPGMALYRRRRGGSCQRREFRRRQRRLRPILGGQQRPRELQGNSDGGRSSRSEHSLASRRCADSQSLSSDRALPPFRVHRLFLPLFSPRLPLFLFSREDGRRACGHC